MRVLDDIFWWTGGLAWAVIAGLLAVFLWWVVSDAFVAGWHLARFYRWGLTKSGRWYTPFKVYWYFFWASPRYVDRIDVNARVYRPFAKELPEDEYN